MAHAVVRTYTKRDGLFLRTSSPLVSSILDEEVSSSCSFDAAQHLLPSTHTHSFLPREPRPKLEETLSCFAREVHAVALLASLDAPCQQHFPAAIHRMVTQATPSLVPISPPPHSKILNGHRQVGTSRTALRDRRPSRSMTRTTRASSVVRLAALHRGSVSGRISHAWPASWQRAQPLWGDADARRRGGSVQRLRARRQRRHAWCERRGVGRSSSSPSPLVFVVLHVPEHWMLWGTAKAALEPRWGSRGGSG